MEVQRAVQFHQPARPSGRSTAAGLLPRNSLRCVAPRWMLMPDEAGGRSSRWSRGDAPCTVSWRCPATKVDRPGSDTPNDQCSSSSYARAWEAGGGRPGECREAVRNTFRDGWDVLRGTSPTALACRSSQEEERWNSRCTAFGAGRWISRIVAGLVIALACWLSWPDVGQLCGHAEEVAEEAFSSQDASEGWQEKYCTDVAAEEEEEVENREKEIVTSESVVEEAWEVVDEFFFDARHREWSREAWVKKKEEVLRRPIRSRMAAYAAIRSMLGSLKDPYTRFLSPDQFSQLTKYDVTGIGLNVGAVTEPGDPPTSRLKVLGIVLGSPAAQAGVRQGDELLSVDGTSVVGKTAFEASSFIQGPKGTSVQLLVRRGPCSLPQQVTVARQQDVRSPVSYRLQPHTGVGYIHVKELNAVAQRDLVTAMQRLEQAGATSLVLDLQDNPGGLVQAGIEIAKVFLGPGDTVVATAGRSDSSSRTIAASALSGLPLSRAPLTVLVNERTASASEIVAAALHDNCRALLVGRRTFGKGLIQSIYELSDGSGVVLTVGKYVTPARADIDGRGIDPDSSRIPTPDEALHQLASCRHP